MRTVSFRDALSFVILCLIWGSTWIGIKAGIETVPPLLFASSRFIVAGLLLLLFARLREEGAGLDRRDLPRFAGVSLLMISLCYGPLFWGMQYVNSGTAAVLEMSLTVIALLTFALLLGEERWHAGRAFAIALGIGGLLILYGPDALNGEGGAGPYHAWGMLAVASSSFTYSLGAVLAKPLLRRYPPFFVAGMTTLVGGLFLLAYALPFEEGALAATSGDWGWTAWGGWLFLVLFGSLIGYTIYMRLLRDIGASRSGSYAFVSPVIAVLLGMVLLGEQVDMLDVLGMAVMIAAAWLALRGRDEAEPAGEATLSEGR
jgi:drug/metabolite transporter (DMT)-like permease